MYGSTTEIPTTLNLMTNHVLPQLVTTSFFIWSLAKTVAMFKKFYKDSMEPVILLELIFLTNFPVMLGSTSLWGLLWWFDNLGYFENLACSMIYWARLSFMGDGCLCYVDKFVALFWSVHYKATVTNLKVTIACISMKIGTLIWTIIFNVTYR